MNTLFEEAKNDSELQSTINIEELLEHAENVDNDYIGDHSLKTISEEIVQVLKSENISIENLYKYCNSLLHYRFIDEVYHIHKGKHIRWIRNKKLTNGGIIVDIQNGKEDLQIICKNRMNRMFSLNLQSCLIFQKMNAQEKILIKIIDYASK